MMAKITAHLRALMCASSGAPDPMDLAAICDAMDAAYDIACRRYEAAIVALEREQGERAELVAESVRQLKALDASTARVDELCKENERLRGLVRDMMAFVEDDDACERCGHDAECVEAADGKLVLPYEDRCLMLDLFADRMRELGVEP